MNKEVDNSSDLAQSVVDAILQSTDEVKIGDDVYTISPPSIATLMLVSAEIKKKALFEPNTKEDLWKEVLSFADDSDWIGDVMTILILGAKRLDEEVTEEVVTEQKYLFGLIKRTEVNTHTCKLKEKLKSQVLNDLSPMEVSVLLGYLLDGMQLDHFFELSTFLSEINLIQKTRKVEKETIASGLQ